MSSKRSPRHFWKQHSLSLVAASILLAWILLYVCGDPKTHIGGFYGNAVADWTGLLVTVVGTKYFYERGSVESRQPKPEFANRLHELIHEHSLTIFLVLTGAGWAIIYAEMDANGKWGQVIGNIVSEWTQLLGIVLLTKRLIERGSKESRR